MGLRAYGLRVCAARCTKHVREDGTSKRAAGRFSCLLVKKIVGGQAVLSGRFSCLLVIGGGGGGRCFQAGLPVCQVIFFFGGGGCFQCFLRQDWNPSTWFRSRCTLLIVTLLSKP